MRYWSEEIEAFIPDGGELERRDVGTRITGSSDLRIPTSAEMKEPTGMALRWYREAVFHVSKQGQDAALQLARLCGDEEEVSVPWRSLADAIGLKDRLGRDVAYAQRGVEALEQTSLLTRTVTGSGNGKRTTFHLVHVG